MNERDASLDPGELLRRCRARQARFKKYFIAGGCLLVTSVILFVVLIIITRTTELLGGDSSSFLLLVSAALLMLGLFFLSLASRLGSREYWAAVPAATGTYNESRARHFEDMLGSLSIAIGTEPPTFRVMDLPSANSYLFPEGGGFTVAVTPALLAVGISDQQVEAILAVDMARALLEVQELERKGGPVLGSDAAGKMMDSYARDLPSVAFDLVLTADTIAARITSNPRALVEAIETVAELVRDDPRVPRGLGVHVSWLMFVEPPPSGALSLFTRGRLERTIRKRIGNLQDIIEGKRRPHQEVRDGEVRPMPGSWE